MTLEGENRLNYRSRILAGITLVLAGLGISEFLASYRNPDSPEFVYGKDPMSDRTSPYDLSANAMTIQHSIDILTRGNEGIVPYGTVAKDVSKAKLILFGEPHFHDGDKVAARELLLTLIKSNPGRQIIVGLGRASLQDTQALEWFSMQSDNLTEDEAIVKLMQKSSLGVNWDGMIDINAQGGGVQEYAKFLLMLRKYHLHAVGLGTDISISSPSHPLSEKDENNILENQAANVLYKLEKNFPDALFFVSMARPHVSRGWENGIGVTTILEGLHSQDNILSSRHVLAIMPGDSADYLAKFNPSIKESLAETVNETQIRNSVLAVRNPQYSSYYYGIRQGDKINYVPDYKKPDYYLLRLVSL